MSAGSTYDRIGRTYSATRRADARIAAAVRAPLAGLGGVVDVCAGTGSYEPPRTVVAVEPSAVMIAQRPAGAAPTLQARAEALPLVDGAVDAAVAVLTVHHWEDLEVGVAELCRVARRRVVVLAFDTQAEREFWLVRDYFPELADTDDVLLPRLVAALREGGCAVAVAPVPVPHDCVDGFLAAWWRRPAAYLDPGVRAGISLLARTPDPLLASGVARLASDLADGTWARRHADLLDLRELDAGYRLVVADLTGRGALEGNGGAGGPEQEGRGRRAGAGGPGQEAGGRRQGARVVSLCRPSPKRHEQDDHDRHAGQGSRRVVTPRTPRGTPTP